MKDRSIVVRLPLTVSRVKTMQTIAGLSHVNMVECAQTLLNNTHANVKYHGVVRIARITSHALMSRVSTVVCA